MWITWSAWRFVRSHAIAIACAASVAVASGVQLFLRPVVGLADNKDFWRVTWRAGLSHLPGTENRNAYFQHILLKWQVIPPWPSEKIRYFTSEVPLARLAVYLNRLVRGAQDFDLRVMGACHLALYTLAIFVFMVALEGRRRSSQVAVALLSALVFSDVRLVAYFNSFFSEGASLIFAIATVGLARMACASRRGLGGWLVYLALLASVAFFCFAKSQNLVFVPLLAFLTALYCPALPGPRGLRVLCLLPALALLAISAWALTSKDAYRASRATNVAVHIEEELLPHSRSRVRDLAELGAVKRDYSKTTQGDIARFYLRHPTRWWDTAQRGADQAFGWPLLGNFEATATTPDRLVSDHFNTWSALKHRLAPRSLALFLATAALLGGLWLYRALAARGPGDLRRALLLLALLAGCIGEFVVTVTFEANGTTKHLFLFNLLTDLLALLLLADLVDLLGARIGRARRLLEHRTG